MFRPMGRIQGRNLIQRDNIEGRYMVCQYEEK
jgi:hypothetical protein